MFAKFQNEGRMPSVLGLALNGLSSAITLAHTFFVRRCYGGGGAMSSARSAAHSYCDLRYTGVPEEREQFGNAASLATLWAEDENRVLQDTHSQHGEPEAVAARSGWQVVRVYEDAGFSGANGRDKPLGSTPCSRR